MNMPPFNHISNFSDQYLCMMLLVWKILRHKLKKHKRKVKFKDPDHTSS